MSDVAPFIPQGVSNLYKRAIITSGDMAASVAGPSFASTIVIPLICTGLPVKVTLHAEIDHSSSGNIIISPYQDNSLIPGFSFFRVGRAFNTSTIWDVSFFVTPTAGSHTFAFGIGSSDAGTYTVRATTGQPLYIEVQELTLAP